MSSTSTGNAGGPPRRAGLWVAGVGGVVALVLFLAMRSPAPPAGDGGNAPALVNGPAAANAPAASGTVAANAPAANTPGNTPAGGSPPPARPEVAGGVPDKPFTPEKKPVDPHDLPPDHPPIVADSTTQVSLQWLGHSCFYIHSPGGIAVVTDPFDPKATGLAKPDIGAHLVTVSANSPEHGFVEAAHPFREDTWKIVRGADADRGDTRVTAIPSYRDAAGGAQKGRNTIYLIQSGAMRIAHLGDLGHPLQPQQLKALGEVDILLLPVGGENLKPAEAVKVAQQIRPKLIIPMAYATTDMLDSGSRLKDVEAFIAASPFAVTRKDSDIILISKPDLPADTEVWSLRYQRGLYSADSRQ